MQRDQHRDIPGGHKSMKSAAATDSADDHIAATTTGASAKAMPLRAAVKNPGNYTYAQVAGPSVGGTSTPYDPAKVELAKEHLADSLNNRATATTTNTSAKNESLRPIDEQKPSITETVRSGAATAATGAAAAAAGVVSAAKKLIGGRDDDDTDESDYTDALASPTAAMTPGSTGPTIKPNTDHGLEFQGEKKKKSMSAGDRASEKVNIVARLPSVKATQGSSLGAKEPSGPLPENVIPSTPPRLSALTLGDPFGPVVVSHWNDFKREHEVSTPSSEDFEREDFERMHPMPDIHSAAAATAAAAATGAAVGHIASSDSTKHAYVSSPLKQSIEPSSADDHDVKLTSYNEPDLSIRREPGIKHSTPLGGMNVDQTLDTSPQRRLSLSGLNINDNPQAPANRRTSIERQGGLNVDRPQVANTLDENRRHRRSSGFNVDVPAEPTAHGGDGSSTTASSQSRPSGTYNTGLHVDRPGSKTNKVSSLGVDSPAKSTYHVKTHQPDTAATSLGSATGNYHIEPTTAVVGAASAMMAAPPLHDTVYAVSNDTAPTSSSTKGGPGGKVREVVEDVKEKLHIPSHHTQNDSTGAVGMASVGATGAMPGGTASSVDRDLEKDKSSRDNHSTGFTAKVAAGAAAAVAAVKGASNAMKGSSDSAKDDSKGKSKLFDNDATLGTTGATKEGSELKPKIFDNDAALGAATTPSTLVAGNTSATLPPSSIGTSGALIFAAPGTSSVTPSAATGTAFKATGSTPQDKSTNLSGKMAAGVAAAGAAAMKGAAYDAKGKTGDLRGIGATGSTEPHRTEITTSAAKPSATLGSISTMTATLPQSSLTNVPAETGANVGLHDPNTRTGNFHHGPATGNLHDADTRAGNFHHGPTTGNSHDADTRVGNFHHGPVTGNLHDADTRAGNFHYGPTTGDSHDKESTPTSVPPGSTDTTTAPAPSSGPVVLSGIVTAGGGAAAMAGAMHSGEAAKEGTTPSSVTTAENKPMPALPANTGTSTTGEASAATGTGALPSARKRSFMSKLKSLFQRDKNKHKSPGASTASTTDATAAGTAAAAGAIAAAGAGALSAGQQQQHSSTHDATGSGDGTAGARGDWTATRAAVVPAVAPKLDDIKLNSKSGLTGGSAGTGVTGTTAVAVDSPHLTSSGLPKADLHATHGVPATKLDAHPTTTINKAYHNPASPRREHSSTAVTSGTTGLGVSSADQAVSSVRTESTGPVGQVGAEDDVVWMKTTTTTTTYGDDDYVSQDANQDGMDEYYGRRNLGGWILGDQGVDKGKQRT
ncbi:hypothetical protein BGZ73_007121 [Actinomortierella ambigua]|nr:hypothetical protein BGZ73_007121 [Actinomortierella ambigua]